MTNLFILFELIIMTYLFIFKKVVMTNLFIFHEKLISHNTQISGARSSRCVSLFKNWDAEAADPRITLALIIT